MPPSIIPYRHLLRLGCLKRNYIRHLSTTPICFKDANAAKRELLSDQRLQAMVAELEKSANLQQGNDILLESIETLKPSQEVITVEEFDKLVNVFEKSFSVRQLAEYSAVHHLPRNKRKKRQLIDGIMKNYWGIQTVEEFDAAREKEALERRRDLVKETLPASFQQMFFIIGSNGDTIRTIEEKHQVLITIDVEKKEYAVEGPSKAVAQAKKEILTHLNIIQEEVDVPKRIKEDTQLKNEVDESLADVSELAGSFITLERDKFSLASTSTENLMNAKRLLNLMLTEMGATSKAALDSADHTIVHKHMEYTVLPMQDASSMPLYDKKLNWNRLEYRNKDEQDDYVVLDSQDVIGGIDNMKDLLVKPLSVGVGDNVSLEARFGKLLFHDDKLPLTSTATNISTLFKNRTRFLSSIPPRNITTPYMPIIHSLDGGFHQRTIQLEYVNESLIAEDKNENSDLKRLLVEFLIQEDGNLNVKKVIAEKNRSVVDIVGLHGRIDVRLLAKQYLNYTEDEDHIQALLEQCKLVGYGEMLAPKQQSILNERLVLSDISFINKKRYLFDDGLISVNHVEQQDKKVKRTEMMVTSVEPQTLDTSNAIERWPSFANILKNIARKWEY
ncbi:uncharacterized protein ATC70_002672 [Mucor velutinosus]|uniref:K Homology domain-containing protein n=1 Tax=Mucor velutinosus TaxID=708070 RepID=A0AAN7I0I2_9FUNG|nr:hypothetical protein ATC70_002672 [Mucor velutinosus]